MMLLRYGIWKEKQNKSRRGEEIRKLKVKKKRGWEWVLKKQRADGEEENNEKEERRGEERQREDNTLREGEGC